MKIRKTKLLESSYYLDPEEKFYDYRTKDVEGEDIFDTNKSEMSYYTQFLQDSNKDYLAKEKNLKGDIVYMSPKEYFENCAKIFGTSTQKQIDEVSWDKNTFNHLKEVIFKYKKRFPITMLNLAERQQEGRHRMYFAGETFGWDKKFPVLVVTYVDEEREKKTSLYNILYDIIRKALKFSYFDIDEFKSQVEYEASNKFEYSSEKYELNFTTYETLIRVSLSVDDIGVSQDVEMTEIKFKEKEEVDDSFIDGVDLSDEEYENILKKYGIH